MTIRDFYQQKHIPKNLQRHMLRVAAVGQYLCQHWNETVDEKSVVKTLLLHDLGNLLKFDLSKGLELLDEDERNAQYWLEVQRTMREKFGNDEHEATLAMAKEAGASERVLFLVQQRGSSHFQQTLESNDWELKICAYADFRVGPFGFVSVEERFTDLLQRYEGGQHALANREKTLEKQRLCLELEQQLQPMVNVNLEQLPTDQLDTMTEHLTKVC